MLGTLIIIALLAIWFAAFVFYGYLVETDPDGELNFMLRWAVLISPPLFVFAFVKEVLPYLRSKR